MQINQLLDLLVFVLGISFHFSLQLVFKKWQHQTFSLMKNYKTTQKGLLKRDRFTGLSCLCEPKWCWWIFSYHIVLHVSFPLHACQQYPLPAYILTLVTTYFLVRYDICCMTYHHHLITHPNLRWHQYNVMYSNIEIYA